MNTEYNRERVILSKKLLIGYLEDGFKSPIIISINIIDTFSSTGTVPPIQYPSITGELGTIAFGQIMTKFEHRNALHNVDDEDTVLISPDDIEYADGWDAEKWLDLLEIWYLYHLWDGYVGMHQRAADGQYHQYRCEHLKDLGYTFDRYGKISCPICGQILVDHEPDVLTGKSVPEWVLKYIGEM